MTSNNIIPLLTLSNSTRDVKLLQDLIITEAIQAYEQKLDFPAKIPEFLTPDRLLNILAALLKALLQEKKRVLGAFIRKRQKISTNPQFLQSVQLREQQLR